MHNELDEFDEAETSLHDLESRIDELELELSEVKQNLHSIRSTGVGIYGLGTIIAVVISWSKNASILWCILHGLLSWLYIAYFAVTR